MPPRKKQTPVVFQSRASKLRVVLVPEQMPRYDDRGMTVVPKKAEVIAQFDGGRFVADEAQAKRYGITLDELVNVMRAHTGHVDNPESQGGEFFEVPTDVAAPPPDESFKLIAQFAAIQDRGELERMLQEEEDGWGRTAVLDQIRETIELMDAANAAHEGAAA